MLTLSPEDFYRIGILLDAAIRGMEKHKDYSVGRLQHVRSSDCRLAEKIQTCVNLGLTAQFRIEQV